MNALLLASDAASAGNAAGSGLIIVLYIVLYFVLLGCLTTSSLSARMPLGV